MVILVVEGMMMIVKVAFDEGRNDGGYGGENEGTDGSECGDGDCSGVQ